MDLSGKILGTVDTGMGEGIGGMTALGGGLYFAHITTRKMYRLQIK